MSTPEASFLPPVLAAEGLLKSYAGRAVVNGVSFEIAAGDGEC